MVRMADRELSALAFHARVLAETMRPETPLMERARFLSIVASGLQEFITVRLGALRAKARKEDEMRPSGMTTSQVLEEAWKRTDIVTMQVDRILHEHILPELAQEGIHLVQPQDVTPVQMAALSALFYRDMMPSLTPILVAKGEKLPKLPSGQVCLAAILEGATIGEEQLAIVQLPPTLPNLVSLVGKGLLMVEDAVKLNLHLVFSDRKILACYPFKVLRDAHAVCKEDEPELRQAVQTCLEKRRKGKILRVVCAPDMPGILEERLCEALRVDRSRAVRRGYVLNPAGVMQAVVNLEGYDHLRYPPYESVISPALEGDLFAAIQAQDHLLCHPYDSFEPVIRLLQQAAQDREVQAIDMTLYRVSEHSPLVAALAEAAKQGIKVTVCVEPRARMDEERNLCLMDMLEKAGCRVVAGIPGMKIHGKALLIVRSEQGTLRRYTHLSTGNYNEATALRYTDFGLLTADERIGEDVERFFAYLAGDREQPDLQELTASPQGMRQELMRLIRREMDKAARGEPCGITCLLNALTDPDMITALTDAARCGVPVDLTVRGACCLQPGVPGETANVTVRSIVGRYLEHGRAFAFGGPGEEEVFLSSADWMKRSLNRRVELLIPVRNPDCRGKLLQCMQLRREPNIRAWRAQMDEYTAARCCSGEELQDVQQLQMMQASSGWPRA